MQSNRSPTPRGSPGHMPRRQRRALSCLPCRLHKLRCDRAVPCQSCCRYQREDRCRLNPSPEAAAAASTRGHSLSSVLPRMESKALPLPPKAASTRADLPPTPLSVVAAESVNGSGLSPYTSQDVAMANTIGEDYGNNDDFQSHKHQPWLSSRQDISVSTFLDDMTVEAATISRSYNMFEKTLLDESATYWKRYLVSILPAQTQCDMFVSYFFENINWIYQAIHTPSFRSQYAAFWTTNVADVDLIWLSLFYMVLCLGALFIPSQMAEACGFEASDLPALHKRWYSASRKALDAGGYDSKPTLTQIQVFLISQLYWYSTKSVEVLNSHMGQAIRNAQAIGLDKEAPSSITNCLEREMRHRIWFQSLCLGISPLLQSHICNVPFPANCNDVEITPTSIHERPIEDPTEMSVHVYRARLFKLLNKLYINNGAKLSSYSFISEIDAEISEIEEEYPWYLRSDPETLRRRLSPGFVNIITWMRHILHSCICIQRVRMYRPFLNPVIGDSWQRCVAASTSALSVYKSLRSPDIARFQRSQKMHVQSYQVFSAAVAMSTFLLVEIPSNSEIIRADIELVIEDLQSHSKTVEKERWVPLIADGRRVVSRILALYDARCKYNQKRGTMQGGSMVEAPHVQPSDAPTALVPAIFSVFGGESSTHRYLERCAIDYIVNDTASVEGTMPNGGPAAAALETSAWDALIDPSSWGQWGDAFWADLDSVLVPYAEAL
ncbi:hypothetical protein G7046_g5920 [Stylonectria norvegica]|nr:hypothetical protein G7046_g5920 [Stylonectria norvegica]